MFAERERSKLNIIAQVNYTNRNANSPTSTTQVKIKGRLLKNEGKDQLN